MTRSRASAKQAGTRWESAITDGHDHGHFRRRWLATPIWPLICVALLVMGLWGLIEVAMTGERTSPKRR